MATLSDGTTDIDLGTANERINPIIDKSSKITAGGNIRSITGGERLMFAVDIRATQATYRSIINLLTNGASNYYYTPNNSTVEWTSLYPNTTWPLNCNINNLKRTWDNRSYFYVSFEVEAISYA
jgi:hypothetical protein